MTKIQPLHLLPRLLLASLVIAAAPLAQAWTDKPVKMLVAAPAGGELKAFGVAAKTRSVKTDHDRNAVIVQALNVQLSQ